jgi:hypothetical protein
MPGWLRLLQDFRAKLFAACGASAGIIYRARSLARAVGAEQAEDLARFDLQVERIERDRAVVVFGSKEESVELGSLFTFRMTGSTAAT